MALNPQRSSLLLNKRGTTATSSAGKTSFGGSQFLAQAGISTGFSLIDEGVQGFADYEATINSAKDLEFQAKQEELIGEQQGLSALEALNDAQAANVVEAFASGIRLQGSVTRAQTELSKDQAFITMIAKTNADIRSGVLEREATRRRAEADYNKKVAPLKIFGGGTLSYFSFGLL